MQQIKELQQVSEETSCTLFNLCVTPKGQWKLYVYKSKLVFIGTIEEVATNAIREFKANRVPITEKQSRHNKATALQKYKYMNKAAINHGQNGVSGNYDDKLAFAKSLGYKTVTQAVADLSSFVFCNQFKKRQNAA